MNGPSQKQLGEERLGKGDQIVGSLLAKSSETILQEKLGRLIGPKSAEEVGDWFLGTKAKK